jgi:hypothetical protein
VLSGRGATLSIGGSNSRRPYVIEPQHFKGAAPKPGDVAPEVVDH